MPSIPTWVLTRESWDEMMKSHEGCGLCFQATCLSDFFVTNFYSSDCNMVPTFNRLGCAFTKARNMFAVW